MDWAKAHMDSLYSCKVIYSKEILPLSVFHLRQGFWLTHTQILPSISISPKTEFLVDPQSDFRLYQYFTSDRVSG